ncbi:MAG: hypothetical protein NTW55_05155 [Planctomycetota bacterium]|nr:hypothetical protein [Planctomycetota bacterium]
MKIRKCYFTLLVIVGILCACSLCIAATDHGDDLSLIAKPNPTLAGIKEVAGAKISVSIIYPVPEPNTYNLSFEELQDKIINKLNEANIPAKPLTPLPIPALKINIAVIRVGDSQEYVFRIQTSLERQVLLSPQDNLRLSADVWKTEPVMKMASAEDIPAAITSIVTEQVEAFIAAYLAANSKRSEPAKADGTKAGTSKAEKSTGKQTAGQAKYVASKNGKVFHTADCSNAKRISPENLVTYSSREEAEKDGKRACKICKP